MAEKLKKITIDDITKYRFPGNLQYSPDGKLLAFNVQRSDVENNCYRTDVWLAEGDAAKQITYTTDARMLFFDDERTLILARKTADAKPGTTELFRLSVDGGEAQPWITLPFPMRSLKKVKDGLYAAVGAIDRRDPNAYKDNAETRAKKLAELEKEKDYTVVDEVPYWFNGAGFTNKKRNALFMVDARDGLKVRRLTAPAFNVMNVLVDGDTVYYTGNTFENRQNRKAKLYAYNTATDKTETVYVKADRTFGRMFVMDGQLYAESSDMKAYGLNQTDEIYRVSKDSLELVYKPEISLYSSTIGDTVHGGGDGEACDGKVFVTLATINDHNVFYEFGKDFTPKTIWEKPGMACFMAMSDEKIAMCYQEWNNVSEVYTMNRDGSDFKRLTRLNDKALEGKYIAEPQPIDYQSEGYDLNGWVLLPKDYDPKKKYPAVLDIHGGPRAAYCDTFFHEMQLWASEGYFVFFTNIKGSDGRGDDFADIRDDYGGTDFRNLMDFTDAVLAKYPQIDEKRVCETGGSYGGFMTNWIIGHTDRFCAAASQRSISNWKSFSLIADIGLVFGPDQCGAEGIFGDANDEKLWNHSPLKYAANVKTPTLFIHSDEDYRCPLPEGMQMMQALAYRNIETRLVIFHGENHELSRSGKPLHRMRRLQEITDWFNKHAK